MTVKDNNDPDMSSQCSDDIRFSFEKNYDPFYVSTPCCLPTSSNLSPNQMLSYLAMRRNGKKNMEDDLQAYIDSVHRQFKSFAFFEETGDLDQIFGQKNAQKTSTKPEPDTEGNSQQSQQSRQSKKSHQSKRAINPLYSRNSQLPVQIQEDQELDAPPLEEPTQEGRDDFENPSRTNMPNQLLSAMKPYFSCNHPDGLNVVAPSQKFMDPYKRLRCSSVGKLACLLNDDGSVFTSNSELEDVYLLERMNSYNTENTLNTSITGNSLMTVETNPNSSSSKEGRVSSQKGEQHRRRDDRGNVILPHKYRAHEQRKQHTFQQQKPKSALAKNNKSPQGALKVKNGKTYRKKLVKFDYPPVKSLKQIPRTDPKDVDKLFFSSEELDRLENDRLNTNSSEVVELIATSESSESEFSMVKQPAQKTNPSLHQRSHSCPNQKSHSSMNHPPQYQAGYVNNSNKAKPTPYQQVSSNKTAMEYSNPYQSGYSGDLSWIDCSGPYRGNSTQTNYDIRHRSDASSSSSGTKNLYWEGYLSKMASNNSSNEETRRKVTPKNHNNPQGQHTSYGIKGSNKPNWDDNRSKVTPEINHPPQRRNVSHITKGIVNHNRRVSSSSSNSKNNNPVKRFVTIDSSRKKKLNITTNGLVTSTPRSTKE